MPESEGAQAARQPFTRLGQTSLMLKARFDKKTGFSTPLASGPRRRTGLRAFFTVSALVCNSSGCRESGNRFIFDPVRGGCQLLV